MYPKERLDNIMSLMKENGYVTVKFLTETLHYSTATINRDLNILEKRNLVRRSYGGVELVEKKIPPMMFRYHKMHTVKNMLAKKAAEFVQDGDTIFIDCSTTTQGIGEYLTTRKDITVITSNLSLVSFLSRYGINVICLGGQVTEAPSVICSPLTIENASKYIVDKLFFSTGCITSDGNILCSGLLLLLHRTMTKNSKSTFYLADHTKVDARANEILFDLNEVDYVISDYNFSSETKEKFKKTTFVEVES